MSPIIRTALMVPGVVFTLNACSSGSSTGTDEVAQETPRVQARIVMVEQDLDGDGEVDDFYDFAYDADGRVTSVTYTSIEFPMFNEVYAFSYDGNDLVSRTNSFETVSFTVENGRVTAIQEVDDFFEENFSFAYNPAGQLVEVEGDALFLDDDCFDTFTDFSDLDAPRYTLSYDSAGRLTGFEGSYNDNLSITYLANGRVGTLSRSEQCESVGGDTAVYTYNNLSLATRALLTSPSGETQETQVIYDGDRLASLTITESDAAGSQILLTSALSYNAEGLLASIATSQSGAGIVGTQETTTTFRYEAERCVEQTFANPVRRLLGVDLAPVTTYEDGLRCGFLMDII